MSQRRLWSAVHQSLLVTLDTLELFVALFLLWVMCVCVIVLADTDIISGPADE